MAQKEIEIILARHLAESLTLPIFIVDPVGNLLFYNEPAGVILGYQFDETGPMPVNRWSSLFEPVDQEGNPLPPEELPLVKAVTRLHPAHRDFWIRGMDGELRKIEVTAFPLVGHGNRFVGAVALFWEIPKG